MPKNKGEINIIGPKKELNAITFEKRGQSKQKQGKKNKKNVISISTKRQIIEQERRKIKEDTGKNTLTKQEKKKAHKKAKKRIAALKYPVLAVIILGAGVATYKNLPIIQENAKNIVDDFTKKNDMDKFKQAYKVSEEEKLKSKEQKELEAQINELQSESDVLAYLKNMYIEKYEQKTGDEKLTTEDIMIYESTENYVFEDKENNNIITHGRNPMETEESLNADGIDYNILEDVKTYDIQTKDGNIIDSIILQTKDDKRVPIRVIPGDRYSEMKNYDSVLDEMGTIIPDGINYMENFKDSNAKTNFVKSILDVEKQNKQTNEKAEQNYENEL